MTPPGLNRLMRRADESTAGVLALGRSGPLDGGGSGSPAFAVRAPTCFDRTSGKSHKGTFGQDRP